jgi:hypothetical protein
MTGAIRMGYKMRRFGLIWLLLAATWVVPADAQLRHADGLAAYDAGDVARARAIWQPLAERGDALAQYNPGGSGVARRR